MFKISIAYSLLILGLSGCQPDPPPDSPAPSYFLTAEVNGVSRVFNSFAQVSAERFPGGFGNVIFSGKDYLTSDTSMLSIGLFNYPPDSSVILKPAVYPVNNYYISAGYNAINKPIYSDYVPDTHRFSVTLTEISTSFIKGTFYGILSDPMNRADSLIITKGKFFLPVLP